MLSLIRDEADIKLEALLKLDFDHLKTFKLAQTPSEWGAMERAPLRVQVLSVLLVMPATLNTKVLPGISPSQGLWALNHSSCSVTPDQDPICPGSDRWEIMMRAMYQP